MKSFIPLIAVLFLAFSVLPLYSQTDAVISYTEGRGFQVVRDGQSKSYDIAADDVIGLPLQADDMILTDDGSFVEILLNNSTVVKLAENTTSTITSLDGSGGGVFRVTYGRIRVKLAFLFGGSRLWITGHDTVAGVRSTDFGYDLFYDLADEAGERQTSVYCFDGEVDVLQYDKETVSKIDLMEIDPFILRAGKMVKTRSSDPDKKLKSKNIDDEIRAYWNAYPIMTSLGGENLEVSENLNLNSSLDTQKGTYETGGRIVFAMGVGMMTIGGLLKAFLPDNTTANNLAIGMLAMGGASIAAGGGMMLYSISLP